MCPKTCQVPKKINTLHNHQSHQRLIPRQPILPVPARHALDPTRRAPPLDPLGHRDDGRDAAAAAVRPSGVVAAVVGVGVGGSGGGNGGHGRLVGALPRDELAHVAARRLDPAPALVRVLEVDARHDGDAAAAGGPQVLAEELRLALEALAGARAAEVDEGGGGRGGGGWWWWWGEQWCGGEGGGSVPACEYLEGLSVVEAGARIWVEGEECLGFVPGAVGGDVEEKVAGEGA